MAIKEKFVYVVGGSGGPLNDSVPVYADDKAPRGDQVIVNGKQLMLPNGFELICVDPLQLIEGVDKKYLYFSQNGYARVWRIGPDGHGSDIVVGKQSWIEYSHLKSMDQPAPEPKEEETDYIALAKAFETIVKFIKYTLS